MRVAVLFIGGMHQALHIAPVAVALAARGNATVSAYVASQNDAATLALLIQRLGAAPLNIIVMTVPGWLDGCWNYKRSYMDPACG